MSTTASAPLIICIGEVLWDCFPDRKVLGGAPLNCAYIAQAMGARSRMISRVGNDPDGREILSIMKGKGLDTSLVQVDPAHPTGTVKVAVNPKGEPTFTIIENVAYDNLAWDPGLIEPLSRCRALCFGSLAQRNAVSRKALLTMIDHAPQALKVFDINLRQHFYTKEILAEGFRLAQVLKLNDGEEVRLKELFPAEWVDGPAGFMKRYQINLMAVTCGADGCRLYRGLEFVRVKGVKVQVADTVGSGDAFTASLIVSLLANKSLTETGREANLWGAYVATRVGGTPAIDRAALDQLRRPA